MRLLLIEDNRSLIASLKGVLARSYKIDVAYTGQEGLINASEAQYDLIILDLGLPDMAGQEVCSKLRDNKVNVPILVLTASAEIMSKLHMFKIGADDYMTKPFNVAELQVRLQALLRRGHYDPEASHVLRVHTLVLDPIKRKVERSGQKIELRRKEFDILEFMMRNKDKVLTRPTIMNNVWEEGRDAWNNTVDVHIKHIRDKIDRPYTYKLIRTVYGLGYTIKSADT